MRALPSGVLGPVDRPPCSRQRALATEWRFLARGAFACLGSAPLARPIRAKSPWNTLFKVTVCHAKISTAYGVLLYPIFQCVARCVCLGPRAMASTSFLLTAPTEDIKRGGDRLY